MNAEESTSNTAFANEAYTGSSENEESGEWSGAGQNVCIANIGPKERKRRLRSGQIGLGVGVVLAALLIALNVNPLFRLVAFLPFAAGASGYFQARDKT